MREIQYNFLHWGPWLCHYKLLPEELEAFNKLEEGENFQKGLAGHLKDEYELDKNRVFTIIHPYLVSYAQGLYDHRRFKLKPGFELKNAWINRQKKNEFNPPHTHDEDLSFVLYTKIPEGLEKECREAVHNSPGPGSITFDFNIPGGSFNNLFLTTHAHFPSVGDMFIFPAALPHWVYPFKTTEGERVSISGNIKCYGSKKE
tara:strand:+ start:435 stop:1040 length:606 start_codon:yes stop_codon:yes gene_type:complete